MGYTNISLPKLLTRGFSDEQIETELQKILNRKPKLKKNIDNVRLELKEKLKTIIFHHLPSNIVENKLYQNLKIIEIFIKRGLFEEAQLLIKRAKKKANELNLNKFLVELLDWELYIIDRQSEKKDMDAQSNLIEKVNHYQFLYTLELRLKNTYRQLNLIIQKDVLLKHEKNLSAFKAIYQQADLKQLSIKEYIDDQQTHIVTWYFRIHNLYYRTTKTLKKSFQYSKTLVSYFEAHQDLTKNFEAFYIKSICGFTHTCFMCDEHHALNRSLEKLIKIYEANSDYNILNIICNIGVIHYLNTFQYKKAIELTNFMEKEWSKISAKSVDGQLLHYCKNNMILFWVLNEESQFKHWLHAGLTIPRSHRGRGYYFGIRMFELINDLEQEQWENFLKKIESLQRTLQNNQNLNAFEKIVLNHFKKLYAVQFSNQTFALNKSKKDKIQYQIFKSLKDELQNSELKSEYINYDEVLLWCESHLQNKSIKEVFEAENKN